jgi:inosine-uridine nucleoside N-ribohydrolase
MYFFVFCMANINKNKMHKSIRKLFKPLALVFAAALAATLISLYPGSKSQDLTLKNVVPVILDTDMESDVDDVGALAMLHALADKGEVNMLGVMVCALNKWSVLCADRINTYFGRTDSPLGVLRGPGVDRESKYAHVIPQEFPGKLQDNEDAPDAVRGYRKILASQPDSSVVMISIGYLTNLRDLLKSRARRDQRI